MPLAFALLLPLFRVHIYFPLRFESLLSVSFALWLAAGATALPMHWLATYPKWDVSLASAWLEIPPPQL